MTTTPSGKATRLRSPVKKLRPKSKTPRKSPQQAPQEPLDTSDDVQWFQHELEGLEAFVSAALHACDDLPNLPPGSAGDRAIIRVQALIEVANERAQKIVRYSDSIYKRQLRDRPISKRKLTIHSTNVTSRELAALSKAERRELEQKSHKAGQEIIKRMGWT